MRNEARVGLALLALGLALAGPTLASDLSDCDEAARLLLAPELRSDQDRASEATQLLASERTRKLADLSSSFVDLGLHASVQAAPLKLLRSVGDIGRELRDWNDRSEVEDEALTLLAAGARNGDLDAASQELFERLRQRETAEHVEQLLGDAERALAFGDLRRARRAVDRALALEPGSSRGDRLLDEVAKREWRASAETQRAADGPPEGEIEIWEIRLGTALLLNDFARAREMGPDDEGDAALARATARFLAGDRTSALDDFARIARGDDASAERARQLLADPEVNPGGKLDDEVSQYRTRRALGWMGGEDLAESAVPSTEDALSFTRSGYRAWQGSYKAWRNVLRPVNLLIDAPARAWRSWQPDGLALHDAAARYLELSPRGDRASEASAWLETLGAQDRDSSRVSAFRDGILVLPRAHTRWGRMASTRVVVSRAALADLAPELAARLDASGAPALLLALDTEAGRATATGSALPADASLALLSSLADGVEQSTLAARGGSASGVLETLRRLDARLRRGRTLVAQAWTPEQGGGLESLGSAVLDGERSKLAGDVTVERNRDSLNARRGLGGSGSFCPRETACIDLRQDVDSTVFARTDADGEVGMGASAGFEAARFSVEVGSSGPRASLVIPFARWLGIGRFFPVQARLAVGLDGISAGPQRDDAADDAPDPSL